MLPRLRKSKPAEVVWEDGIPVVRSQGFVPPKRIRFFRRFWYRKWDQLLEKYLTQHPMPDVLHAHSFVGGAAARFLAAKYNLPYIITEHYDGFISGRIPPHWRDELGDIYRQASKVIAVSHTLAERMYPYCETVTVIPNMIDTGVFYPPASLPPSSPMQIVTVGGLDSRKNQAALLRVFARIQQQVATHLTIIGAGPLREEYQELAEKLGIPQKVTFTGALLPRQVAGALRKAHLYVSTSTSESFALAPVEALACGLPVVMLRCGSILEQYRLRSVRIVEVEADLDEAMLSQLNETARHGALHDSEFIRREFSPRSVTEQIRKIYEAV